MHVVVVVVAVLALVGCNGTMIVNPKPTKESQIRSGYSGSHAGAEHLLHALMKPGGDPALTRSLMPRPEDYAIVFTEPAATDLAQAYKSFWASPQIIGATDHQIELRLLSATTEELQHGREIFPDWEPILPQLQPGFTWYRFKFVRPGDITGLSYDGLVYINDHWAWFPEPWRHVAKVDETMCKQLVAHVEEVQVRGLLPEAAAPVSAAAKASHERVVEACVKAGKRNEFSCVVAAQSVAEIAACKLPFLADIVPPAPAAAPTPEPTPEPGSDDAHETGSTAPVDTDA